MDLRAPASVDAAAERVLDRYGRVDVFVPTLAAEVGALGIRVNLVSPGGVEGERLTCRLDHR